MPDDGAFPAWQGAGDGVLPTLIPVGHAAASSAVFAGNGHRTESFESSHPQAETIAAQLHWLGAAHLIALEPTEGAAALVAEF